MAASSAAQRSQNRPWLEKKLRPIFAPLRAIGVMRRDPKQKESGIGVVGIVNEAKYEIVPKRFRHMLCKPGLALPDPSQNLAHGWALACQGIPIDPLLKRFLYRDLAGAAAISHGEGLFHDHLERGGP
jgi:hypothetical protein